MTDPLGSAHDSTAVPRVLTRAPNFLPLEIRLPFWRYLFISRLREVIIAVPFCLAVMAAGAWLAFFAGDTEKNDVAWGIVGIAFGLFLLAYTPVNAKRQWKDGFSLGADHTGVYLRPYMDKDRAVFVPWECVEGIYTARWMGPQLAVKPCDTAVEGQFDLAGVGGPGYRRGLRMAQKRRIEVLGTNIHAPIPGVNQKKLLTDLRYYADGRAPVIGS